MDEFSAVNTGALSEAIEKGVKTAIDKGNTTSDVDVSGDGIAALVGMSDDSDAASFGF